MKKRISVILLFLLCPIVQLLAQAPVFCDDNTCYQKEPCFAGAINTRDYAFSKAGRIFGRPGDSLVLNMTVYSACALPDSAALPYNPAAGSQPPVLPDCSGGCKRPFILLIHGGGFKGGCRTTLKDEAEAFARRGYVVASIDYRLGWIPFEQDQYANAANPFCMPVTDVATSLKCKTEYKDSANFAQYKGIQDGHAALRFMAWYAEAFNINAEYMYIGGNSAGAVISVNLAYMQQPDFNAIFPGIKDLLGNYNSYGNNLPNIPYRLAGLYNCWGAIGDTVYIALNKAVDRVPMIAFHGTDDGVVPFERGPTNNCNASAPLGTADGSQLLYNRLGSYRNPRVPAELYAVKGGHGIFEGNPLLTTDDGLKALYKIQKAVCFFRRVRQGDVSRSSIVRPDIHESQVTATQLNTISPVVCEAAQSALEEEESKTVVATNALEKPLIRVSAHPFISCRYSTAAATQVGIQVLDMHGRIADRYDVRQPAGTHAYHSVKKLAAGVYIVTVQYNGRQVFAEKIVVK